jgi:hypothetical protein
MNPSEYRTHLYGLLMAERFDLDALLMERPDEPVPELAWQRLQALAKPPEPDAMASPDVLVEGRWVQRKGIQVWVEAA